MADQYINSDTADIPSVNFAQQGSDPAAPAAGRWQLFFKSGGLYARKSDGTVVGPFASTVGIATDPFWTAANQLAVSNDAADASPLAKGSNGMALTINAAGAGPAWQYMGWFALGYQTATGVETQLDFTSFPANYQHLHFVGLGRSTEATQLAGLALRFNDDSGANYHTNYTQGNGTTTSTGQAVGATSGQIARLPGSSATASYPGAFMVTIPLYSGTTFYKQAIAHMGASIGASSGNEYVLMQACTWASTSAITKVSFVLGAGAFVSGTRISAYASV